MEKRQMKYRELSDLGQVTQPARSRALEQILQADFNFCPGGKSVVSREPEAVVNKMEMQMLSHPSVFVL